MGTYKIKVNIELVECEEMEEKGVGWDLPLDQPEMFQSVLQKCVDMDQDEYGKWSARARAYGVEVIRDDGVVEQNRKLF